MESNYNITQTKSASLRIGPDFSSKMLEGDTADIHAVPYNVYNINCVYNYNNPMEFLGMLTDYAKQQSIDLALEEIAEDIICIKHRGNVVARYSVARKHIDIECDLMYDVMDLRHGNKINTYNVLKYILKTISVYECLDKIRKFKHHEFEVLHIRARSNNNRWIPRFNAFRQSHNMCYVLINDSTTEMNFAAIFHLDNKMLVFENFLQEEGETYSNGYDALTLEQIDMQIQFYTNLKSRIADIRKYLANIQVTL